jgi:hypothetical protein
MLRSMNGMAPRCMGMMCRFLVVSCLVVLRGFAVMPGCVSVVLGCLFVVVGGFLRDVQSPLGLLSGSRFLGDTLA